MGDILKIEDLRKNIREPLDSLKTIEKNNPVRIPEYYLSLINWDDPKDPIRKMCVPSSQELQESGDWDTSGESNNTQTKALQHKYQQTALLLSTNMCRMFCRFCFRKRLVGTDTDETVSHYKEVLSAVDYVRAHPEITNILISGGDPLTRDPYDLQKIVEMFADIGHLRYIRIGTRVPVVDPDILHDTKNFAWMGKIKKLLWVVTHFNHPREVTPKAKQALDNLRSFGCSLNNQTVLLRGVNDEPSTLAELMSRLVENRVTPYYIFQCRPTKKVTHFQVTLKDGARIIADTQRMLDGHAKRFRYVMSHVTGKIEIIGGDPMIFRYHQAEDPSKVGKIFSLDIGDQCWLDDSPLGVGNS